NDGRLRFGCCLRITSSGPALHEMTPATISSELVPNATSSTPFVPPSRTDWDMLFQSLFDELLTPLPSVDHPALEVITLIAEDLLFQPLFDELLTPPPSVDLPAPKVIAPIAKVVAPEPAESTGSPSSTTVDQDAPSPIKSQTTPKTQSLVISNDVEEENYDLGVAHIYNDLFFVIPILENDTESSSLDVIPTVGHTAAPNSEHVTK
nr:hypothetical protein [Tanacetum cinerariifolium]